MGPEGLMVSVSGIRGRVGAGLTPEIVTSYAAAFGAWATASDPAQPIVVGRDSRVSGPMFHRCVLSALQSVGAGVIDLGLTTTPTCQLAVEHHHAGGGLMISASHNPIEWNALKFVGPSGLFLDAAEGARMRALVGQSFPRATWERLGVVEPDPDAARRHIDHVLALPVIDVDRIRARRFHVALDCCRGAGAVIMPALL
jgi:phosphomannomutase